MKSLPYQMDEAAICREVEDAQRRVLTEVHGNPEKTLPVLDLQEFVGKMFDGTIGDHDVPFDDLDDARLAVECALSNRARRPLTRDEEAKVRIAVALEWNRRVHDAKLLAFTGHAAR
jgi:hypothetical protein